MTNLNRLLRFSGRGVGSRNTHTLYGAGLDHLTSGDASELLILPVGQTRHPLSFLISQFMLWQLVRHFVIMSKV